MRQLPEEVGGHGDEAGRPASVLRRDNESRWRRGHPATIGGTVARTAGADGVDVRGTQSRGRESGEPDQRPEQSGGLVEGGGVDHAGSAADP